MNNKQLQMGRKPCPGCLITLRQLFGTEKKQNSGA